MEPLFVVVTQLGDLWFVFLLLATLYLWGGRLPGLERAAGREPVAYVMALGIGAMGLTFALKLLLEIPRPPGAATPPDPEWLSGMLLDLYREAASEDGYDMPSGHAVGAVVVYGGLALAYGERRWRAALGVAAALAGLVGASRVVIGVHSVPAVVAGLLIGASYLWLVGVLTNRGRHVSRAFGVAAVTALSAVATGGVEPDVVSVLGLAAGGLVGWLVLGARVPPGPEAGVGGAVRVVTGLVVVLGAFAAVQGVTSPLLSLALSGLLAFVLLALPVVWTRSTPT